MLFAGIVVAGVAVAVALVLRALQGNLVYFFSPSQVLAGEPPAGRNYRIGGLVVARSIRREQDGLTVNFDITDTAATIPVRYKGILPDLFREGQGIVALGRRDPGGVFVAEEVLAKHDEKYMPPEVAEALNTARSGGSMRSSEAANP